MTKTSHNPRRQAGIADGRGYLARFFGFFFTCGSGGLFSIFRSISSARFNASARGTWLDLPAGRALGALFMVEPHHG